MADPYGDLAKYFGGPPQKMGASAEDIAKFIVMNSKKNNLPGPTDSKKKDSPSLMGRIFDILSRPNYAVAEFAREWIETGDPNVSAFAEGLAGNKKTTFSKVLKEAGVEDEAVRGMAGLFLDIGLDPLTYVGAGSANKIKGAVTKAPGPPPNRPLAEELLSKGEPVNPELFNLPTKQSGGLPTALKNVPSVEKSILPVLDNAPVMPGKVGVPGQQQLGLDLTELAGKALPSVGGVPKAAKIGEVAGQIPFKFPGLNIKQTKAESKAQAALAEGEKAKLILDKIGESQATVKASGVLSDAQQHNFDGFLKNFSKQQASKAGLSAAGVNATGKLVKDLLIAGKSPAQLAIEQKAKLIDDVIATGKGNPDVNRAVTVALETDLGKLPRYSLAENKTQEYVMARVATAWGQKDLRPMSMNMIASSSATAAARGTVLQRIMKPFDLAQRNAALKAAQGYGTVGDPALARMSDEIRVMMENLTSQVSGASVIARSGVSMDMLNKWMKRYGTGFEFTKGKIKDITGKELDFSKGSDWTQSWKAFDIKGDPEVVLFKLNQAMEQATREKALFDQLGEELGSKFYGRDFRVKIEGHPYLNGYYFPEDIAKQIPRVVKDWSVDAWKPGSPLMKHYDRVLSMWKAGVTIYRPGHHIRNMIGDVYLGWMDGVNSVRPYYMATKVQKVMGSYKDMADVQRMVEVGALSRNFSMPKPNEVIFRNKSGVGFTAEQIGAVAHQKGLLEHARTIEDIIDLGEGGSKSILDKKPFGGRVQAVARGASELQSHNARLAHFIDKVMKSKGNDLPTIFEDATRRARKWHPTGLDLTDFERKNMRRLIPFYSWIRKSVPLLIEGLVMNPGKAVIPSKVYGAVQEMQGIETPGRHDPFPVDQMFPKWLRSQGVGPISLPEGFMGSFTNQTPPGYAMGGMGINPLSDLMAQIEGGGKSLASSTTPAIQIPVELATGRKIFSQEPISGVDARPGAMEEYIGEHIPIFSAAQGITGITPFGGETKRASRSDSAGTEALVNWLTGLGVRGTGPYQNQARYEAIAPIRAQRKLGKEELVQELRRRGEQ